MKAYRRRILVAGVAGLCLAASATAWAAWSGHRSAAVPQPQNRVMPVAPTRVAGVTPLPGQPLNLQHMSVSLSNHVYYQNRVVVVTFHDISPDVYSPYVITPETFAADLDAFHEHFNVITNQQFIDFLDGRGTVPPNAILLTFDDGYRNMYT
ncbi:MAG: hypothetical protein K6T31_08280, partial [Alicyclobacillus sp.]|nr:hypothetical protein [Alicyclobacillus sp.]